MNRIRTNSAYDECQKWEHPASVKTLTGSHKKTKYILSLGKAI